MPEETQTAPEARAPKRTRRWRGGMRHGLRTRQLPFVGGKAIEQYRNCYRRAVEDELQRQGREIGVVEATIVAAAVAAFEHASKAGFWLANNHDTLTPDQRLAFSREEMKGMGEAARLLKQLGIERNPVGSDPWTTLHAMAQPPLEAEGAA